ncbi:MAG: glycosyltransferase [Nitrospirota bacterium]
MTELLHETSSGGDACDPRSVALVLVNNNGLGGAERRFAQAYEGLRRRGVPIELVINESLRDGLVRAGLLAEAHRPGLLLPEPFGRLTQLLPPSPGDGGPVRNQLIFFIRKLDYGLGSLLLGRWLRRRRPAAVHLVLGGAYLAWPWQTLGLAPPAILSLVCPNLRELVGASLGLWLYRRAIKKARLVDALTDSIGETARREGAAPDRVRVSGGSLVDVARFQPAQAKRPWVVFAGRLIEEKNPLLFVQACALVRAQLKDAIPGVRFFLLGDGPLREEVEALIRRHGLDDCLEVGWREKVEPVLAQALVFVSLQRMDNYPSQALLEAMASGAAAVATEVGLTGKLVDETVGRLVQATPESVADAVLGLLRGPERAEAMGRRARERVVRDHSLDAYLAYLSGLYGSVGPSSLKGASEDCPSGGSVREKPKACFSRS